MFFFFCLYLQYLNGMITHLKLFHPEDKDTILSLYAIVPRGRLPYQEPRF